MSTKKNLDRTNAEVLANAKKGRGRVRIVKLDPAAKAAMERKVRGGK